LILVQSDFYNQLGGYRKLTFHWTNQLLLEIGEVTNSKKLVTNSYKLKYIDYNLFLCVLTWVGGQLHTRVLRAMTYKKIWSTLQSTVFGASHEAKKEPGDFVPQTTKGLQKNAKYTRSSKKSLSSWRTASREHNNRKF